MDEKDIALEAIRKKLVGKKLNYREIYSIMDQIAKDRLGDIATTYFVASGYSKGFSNEEIYYLTRAMVETGERLHFRGIVADKHSTGGTPGTRSTLILVPIVAAVGFKIPKSSSRAITTPSGTADAMEVLCSVNFTKEEIYTIVKKTNACIVWGGSVNIAPADDEIIQVEQPLLFESYDKILVSVMAKKIAFGSSHIVIDLPYSKTVKIHRLHDAEILRQKFEYLAKRFGVKIRVLVHKEEEPAGHGVGPLLEARDALKVLEQKEDRPLPLEKKALFLAGALLELCLHDASEVFKKNVSREYRSSMDWAKDILVSGRALTKMREIINAQGGNPNISSEDLKPAQSKKTVVSASSGKIVSILNKNITLIARILGAPEDKRAGIYFHKRLHDAIERGEEIFTFYSESTYKIGEAIDSLELFPIYEIEK